MNIKAVIGANYGDEGKGLMSAYFCSMSDDSLNILTNGGSQRGHTVTKGDNSHIYKHFGAGSAYAADTAFSDTYILNPMNYIHETGEIGMKYTHADPGCRWSTPYDMMVNQIIELSRGDKRHGSVGTGIWETVLRYKRNCFMDFQDFLNLEYEEQKKFLLEVRDYHIRRLAEKGINVRDFSTYSDTFLSDTLIDNFIADAKIMGDHMSFKMSNDYENIVFENGQGLLLSGDDNNDPFTTPSDTGCRYVVDYAEKHFQGQTIELCYVTRTYLTRHGNGPLDKETDFTQLSSAINEKTNKTSEFQGRFRYAPLNISDLHDRILKDFNTHTNPLLKNKYELSIAVTHEDELKNSKEITSAFPEATHLYVSFGPEVKDIIQTR